MNISKKQDTHFYVVSMSVRITSNHFETERLFMLDLNDHCLTVFGGKGLCVRGAESSKGGRAHKTGRPASVFSLSSSSFLSCSTA